jgi:transcription initiation factor TFIID subunit TAF12
VAQRQQQQQQRQQQLQQQQQHQVTGSTPTKILPNMKPKQTIVASKKVQRLNGAKVIVTNNCEKVGKKEPLIEA